MAVKTENEQWADVINFIKQFLKNKNISNWTVKQNNQTTLLGIENYSIYITRVSSKRYGWQSRKDLWDKDKKKIIHYENYIQEVLYQISAFCKRNIKDIGQITSSDVLNSLITYIQSSFGMQELRKSGYQTLRISDLREPVISTDSDQYEKMPSFDMLLILKQSEETEEASTNKMTITMKGI